MTLNQSHPVGSLEERICVNRGCQNRKETGTHAHRAMPRRTRTPRGATFTGSTLAPVFSIAAETFAFAPRSTRKNTQPPPPAPHALAPKAPAFLVTATSRSWGAVL